MRTWSVVLLALGLMMAGCLQSDAPDGSPEGGSDDGTDESGTGTGKSDGAGTSSPGVERSQSDVTTGQANGRWYARQTVILKNDASSAAGDASFETVSGGVDVVIRSGDAYQITVSLEGRGDTREEAKERLQDMRVDHEDSGSWTLATKVRDPDGDWSDQKAAVHASLPSSATWSSLLAKTVSGGVSIDGVVAGTLEGRAISGGVSCTSVEASSLTLHTESGGIDCSGTADDASMSATSGGIDVELEAAGSGDWSLSTTSGGISLTAPEDSSRGYDITAEATSGGIDFDFEDTQVVSEEDGYSGESRHERTNGFGSRSIQTTVDLETVSGSIDAGS